MSIPKAGSRLLHLGGGVYRWRVRGRPTYCQANGWSDLSLAIEDADYPGGAVLLVSLGTPHPSNWFKLASRAITPAQVSTWVRQALSLGWQPQAPGSQFFLSASSAKGRVPNKALQPTAGTTGPPAEFEPLQRPGS